jgi:hypothetical protein
MVLTAVANLAPPRTPLSQFFQELRRGDIERIFLEDAADDNHRMRAQNIDDSFAAKLCEIINANDNVVVLAPDVVHARFEGY